MLRVSTHGHHSLGPVKTVDIKLQLTFNRKREIGENFIHRGCENENQNVMTCSLCVVNEWLIGRGEVQKIHPQLQARAIKLS